MPSGRALSVTLLVCVAIAIAFAFTLVATIAEVVAALALLGLVARRAEQWSPGGSRSAWGWFVVWALIGAVGALSVFSPGVFLLLPVVALGIFLASRPRIRRSAFGVLTGVGAVLLSVAWVQRDGPGTTCWHSANGSGCDQHLDPLPWLAVGALLLVAGFVAQARRR